MTRAREEMRQIAVESADRLRALRLALGYDTAAGFAQAIGYPPKRYQRYERRLPLRPRRFVDLAHAIEPIEHVSLDWLLDGDRRFEPKCIRRSRLKVVN